MTLEARIGFVIFFFGVWLFLGLLSWAVVAVLRRGRGALPALPLGLAAASAAGVLVPALGWQDAGGFVASLFAATGGGVIGSLAGVAFSQRMGLVPPDAGKAAVPEREREEVAPDA